MQYSKSTRKNKNIFVVDIKKETDKILSEIANYGITKYQNTWIISNKKWYSWWVVCNDCWHIPKCKNCDISISYYQNDRKGFFGICNICNNIYNEFIKCPNCQSKNIKPYGTWMQKLSEYIYDRYNIKTIEISRSTSNNGKKIQKITEELKKTEKNIILWTSLLSTAIKNIQFDLLIFQNADIGQNLPSYDSNYNSFMTMYNTIANHKNTNNFVIQTSNPDSDVVKYIYNMDIKWFLENDNEKRQIHLYPPSWEIVSLLYKNELETRLFNSVNKLYQEIIYMKNIYISWLKNIEDVNNMQLIEVFATPPMIYKIYGKYRYNIVIKWPRIRDFLEYIYTRLNISQRGFKVDWWWSGV